MNDLEYKTVSGYASAEIIEKKSKFIGYISPADTEEAAWQFLEFIRQKHRDATHNVYAYILNENNINKFSDDGEPAKTAGAPVLDVISGEGLTNVIIVVTRYFGGTLLGTGGLVKAYKQAAKAALDNTKIVIMTESVQAHMNLPYNLWGRIEKELELRGCITEKVDFSEDISVSFICKKCGFDAVKNSIADISGGNVVPQEIDTLYYGF